MSFSLGLIEVEALGHAIFVLDAMTKAAEVEFVATERRLGGRLVTLVVRGQVSAVSASIEAGKAIAEEFGCLKASEVIARPHPEILKFLHLDEKGSVVPVSETAATHVGAVEKAETKTEEKKEKTPSEKVEKAEKKTPAKTVSKPVKKASDKKAPAKKGAKTNK